jgi:hypothetical protein
MSVINSEWVMVPREPTEAMCKAGWTTEDPTPVGIWALMIEAAIAAAPQEPVAWATLVDDEVCAVSLTKMAANLRAENLRGENRGRDFVVSVAPLYAAPQPSAEPTTECTTCGATVVRVTGVYDYPPPGDELVQAARDALRALKGVDELEMADGGVLYFGDEISALRRALAEVEAKGGGR